MSSLKCLLQFFNKQLFTKAMTTKVHDNEYRAKTRDQLNQGHNEDYIVIGLWVLDFFFSDYLLMQGYPRANSRLQKSSDILLYRQKLFCDKNFAELATLLNLQTFLQVGNQQTLKSNQKVLSDAFKALVAAIYYDKFCDLEAVRELLAPIFIHLMNKGEQAKNLFLISNPKSAFLEYINQFKNEERLKPKITLELDRENNITKISQQSFKITLQLDDFIKIQRTGYNKREIEQQVYQEALVQLKNKFKQNQKPIKCIKEPDLNVSEINNSVDRTGLDESYYGFDSGDQQESQLKKQIDMFLFDIAEST